MSTSPSSSITVKSAVNDIQKYRDHSENAQKAGSYVLDLFLDQLFQQA